jgi:CRISPR-associated exonuclease Cas4
MHITATHINYYQVCRRKLWLFATGIQMEHTSGIVDEANILHQDAYPNRSEKYKEISLDGIKIDFFDAKEKVVHEVKNSSKMEHAHIAQVKYYLYRLKLEGILATGLIEYPKERKTNIVLLSDDDLLLIADWEANIKEIINSDNCPTLLHKPICKQCSYFEFCYASEI